jgi:uncharacterized protein YndB with AHSA1/START domain
MKIVKVILLVVVAIIALVLIIALFVKKDYAVEREVTINKPKAEVFNYIKYLKNQDHYSKWNQIDPAMDKKYQGTDGTVGFIYFWDSKMKEAGKGEQEIKNIQEGERIDFEVRFKKPFESVAPVYMITESADDNQTKVKWGFKGRMPYPMNIMQLFMDLPGMIGNDLQTGLDNLKNILEK